MQEPPFRKRKLELRTSADFQPQLFQRLAEDFLRRGVNQKAIIEHHAQWIVPDYEPDRVILVQNGKHERTLDLLSHSLQAVEVEGFIFL